MAVAGKANRHLPSLDGLRAISILLVILGHLSRTRGFPHFNPGIGDYAHLGVVVFFAISGFLITTLLIQEHAATGRISLKLFYARRALRIFPASYAFLACVALLALAGFLTLPKSDLWAAVTYTVNYYPHRSWAIGHLWSLSVEEQFYLLWPFAFLLARPWRAGWVAAGVILLAPVARAAAALLLRGTPYRDLEMFPMVADSLAAGCLLALVKTRLEASEAYLRLFRPVWSILLVALVLVINRYMVYTAVGVFGPSVVNLALAILIHRSVYHSSDWMGRVLNWRPIAAIGALSYSLYLWQQIFLDYGSTKPVNSFPLNILLAVAAALTSYLLLEKPLMKLRHRLRS